MLLFASLYPLVPSATLAVALLVPVNFFAAFPWGAATAATADVLPPRLRAQGTALYLLVVNLVSGALGPTAVAIATQRIFGGDAGLRYGLASATAAGMTLAILLLSAARQPYREAVTRR